MRSGREDASIKKTTPLIVLCIEGVLIIAFVIANLPVFRSSAAATVAMPLLLLFGIATLGWSHNKACRVLGVLAVAALILVLLYLALPNTGTITVGVASTGDFLSTQIRAIVAIACVILSTIVAFYKGEKM
ncbi:MAG: hypothetical protein LUH09_08065 [Clostridiales bacterium]|nr:hypothetical protein [Clostridiales bacterium]